MADNDKKGKQSLGRMDVQKKALRIQELGDKVGTAIKMFESAQQEFEKGEDSSREWKNIIKVLNIQIKDMRHFQAVAHHNIGIIHAGKAEFKKAESRFKKAVEIDPDYAMAYYNLAVVYKKLNDKEKARKNYLKAKELGYEPS